MHHKFTTRELFLTKFQISQKQNFGKNYDFFTVYLLCLLIRR